jgi:DNA polymerase III epsilon subunit-like protein
MIILDIEASGVDYLKNSIVSLGALELENPDNRIYLECRVWDGAHINDEAMAVNGFTHAEVTDINKMSEAELLRNVIGWALQIGEKGGDMTLAGQNPSFDRDYLKAACERSGVAFPFAHRTIDTHSLCYLHMVHKGIRPPVDPEHHRSALNLDAVLNYCGIPDEPEPHNALTGALSHAEVVHRLLYGEKLLPEFVQFEVPFKRGE